MGAHTSTDDQYWQDTLQDTILLASRDDTTRARFRRIVGRHAGSPRLVMSRNVENAQRRMGDGTVSLAIFDLKMSDSPQPSGLADLHRTHPKIRLAIVATQIDQDALLSYICAGVRSCILESEDDDTVLRRLQSALEGEVSIPEINVHGARAPDPSIREAMQARAPSREELDRLTDRQREVLGLLERGMTNKEISRELCITPRTVKMHLSGIYRTLGVHNRTQALAVLIKLRDR